MKNEFFFEWTQRREANDADEARGIAAAYAYCADNGLDVRDAAFVQLDDDDNEAQAVWWCIEAAAIEAMCEGWHQPTENASLAFRP